MAKPLLICVDLSMKNPQAQNAVYQRLQKVTQINDTMRDRLRTAVNQGMDQGESIEQIAKRIQKELQSTLNRARTIARTEVNAAAADARTIQFKAVFGKDYKKEWVSSRDAFVRIPHEDVDGEIVAANELFSNGLDRPHDPNGPANEVINCRCVELAHPNEEE